MGTTPERSIEDRVRAIEDQLAIYQVVCGYGYAADGCDAEAVRSLYAHDGVYAVADVGVFAGRDRVAAVLDGDVHRGLVAGGCAHISTLPYVIVDGDRATATCHTMVVTNGDDGYGVARLSASRLELSRVSDGRWQIDHRQNHPLQGAPEGSELLARFRDGPSSTE